MQISPPAKNLLAPGSQRRDPPELYDLRFFEVLKRAVEENPPPEKELALLDLFKQINWGNTKDEPIRRGLLRAIKDGNEMIQYRAFYLDTMRNGWATSRILGRYGTDYLLRATIARGGFGANVIEETGYWKASVDSDGNVFSGVHRYVMRFEKGRTPPVDAFWSVTMYELPSYNLVPNPIKRYGIGTVTKDLKYNLDGSLDIYIQVDRPSDDKVSNWLPAPKGEFYLICRAYEPRLPVRNFTYSPPSLKRIE